MTFDFEQRTPTGLLARWVRSVWFARGRISYAREQIAPTGSTVAVLNLGDPIVHATEGSRATRLRATIGWLTGPHDRPSLNEPTGETHCYGVVSTAIGCLPLFGSAPAELRGRVVPLAHWQQGPALRAAVAGLEPSVGLTLLVERLAAALSPAPAGCDRVERAVEWLDADPGLSISAIAERLGVSHAHLDRQFRRVVGLSPRRLAAILRVRRLLSDLDVFATTDWSDRTADYGWYDQSHLIRDFRRYTGVTPTAYIAAQREHFEPAEADHASGFVPQGPPRKVKSVQDASPDDPPD